MFGLLLSTRSISSVWPSESATCAVLCRIWSTSPLLTTSTVSLWRLAKSLTRISSCGGVVLRAKIVVSRGSHS